MNNKTEKKIDKLNASKFYQTHNEDTTIQSKAPADRIFPPPAFLFDAREERNYSQRKINYATLGTFKQKIQMKHFKQPTDNDDDVKKNEKTKSIDIQAVKASAKSIRYKKQRRVESQLNTSKHDQKVHFDLRYSLQQRQKVKVQQSQKTGYQSQHLSPYSKYNTNSFPRKTFIGKPKNLQNKEFLKNQFAIEVGASLKKKSISEIVQSEINSKMQKIAASHMLQVMTIFSIKEQKCEKVVSLKHTFIRKKQLYQSLPAEEEHKIRYKKHPPRFPDQEPDLSTDKIYSKKISSFLTFANKVNFSNDIPISKMTLNEKHANEKVKVFVGKGNNKCLIIALLKRRFWLQVTNKITNDVKFIWTQNSIKEIHELQPKRIQTLINTVCEKTKTQTAEKQTQRQETALTLNPQSNSLKQNNCIFSKIRQIYSSCKTPQGSPFKPLHRLQKISIYQKQQNKKLFMNPIKANKSEWLLRNFKVHSSNRTEPYDRQKLHRITNHIPQNSYIGSKKALFFTMESYYRNVKQIDPFTIIPKTYHFKHGDQNAYSHFLSAQKQSNQKKIWIVKPGQCTNRGNGITLMRAADISRRLLKKQNHPNGQPKTSIVQSYITDPLLYNGRKFDIRHYMMITIINGNLKAYWYSEGYLRTSSQYFSLENLGNLFIHLTNDAIQKYSEKYGRYEPANKLSYTEFQRYLENNFSNKQIKFREQILTKMKEIATDVIRANYLNLDKARKMNNFQIFGLDFMIDSKFGPWLIEINANPCLQINCPLLSRIIPIMVEHSLRLGLDPLLLPPSHYPPHSRYYLSDKFIENLRYEIIFDELEEKMNNQVLKLNYDFQFQEPEDQYENQGAEIDLAKLLD